MLSSDDSPSKYFLPSPRLSIYLSLSLYLYLSISLFFLRKAKLPLNVSPCWLPTSKHASFCEAVGNMKYLVLSDNGFLLSIPPCLSLLLSVYACDDLSKQI